MKEEIRMQMMFHTFLNLAVHYDYWPDSQLGRFNPGKRAPGLSGPQFWKVRGDKKNSAAPGHPDHKLNYRELCLLNDYFNSFKQIKLLCYRNCSL